MTANGLLWFKSTVTNDVLIVIFICKLFLFERQKNKHVLCGFFFIRVRVMVFNTTFNNISVILWQSVLLVEETSVHGVYEENHCPAASR